MLWRKIFRFHALSSCKARRLAAYWSSVVRGTSSRTTLITSRSSKRCDPPIGDSQWWVEPPPTEPSASSGPAWPRLKRRILAPTLRPKGRRYGDGLLARGGEQRAAPRARGSEPTLRGAVRGIGSSWPEASAPRSVRLPLARESGDEQRSGAGPAPADKTLARKAGGISVPAATQGRQRGVRCAIPALRSQTRAKRKEGDWGRHRSAKGSPRAARHPRLTLHLAEGSVDRTRSRS